MLYQRQNLVPTSLPFVQVAGEAKSGKAKGAFKAFLKMVDLSTGPAPGTPLGDGCVNNGSDADEALPSPKRQCLEDAQPTNADLQVHQASVALTCVGPPFPKAQVTV